VMSYEMLTGSLPFNATTPWQWATEHMTAQPFPIEQRPTGYGIPKTMREAVMRTLAKAPDERPPTTVAFVAELKAGLAGPVSATDATQAMQAVVPPSQAAVDTSARTGALPALASASTLRSQEASAGTEAGLSALQPTAPKRSSAGLLVGGLLGATALGFGAWFALSGPGAGPAAPPEAEPPGVASGVHPEPTPAPPPPPPPVTPTAAPLPPASAAPTPSATTPTLASSSPTHTSTPKNPGGASTPVACSECLGLVGSGSWSRATQAYASCDAAGQKQCSAKAKREAPDQAERASAAKKCTQVQAILKGATAMGAATSRVKTAADHCK